MAPQKLLHLAEHISPGLRILQCHVLLLAGQYESWTLPLAIILIVPMCLLAAATGLQIHGMPIDILAQAASWS